MEFFDVLRNEKPVFVLDDVEDKKTKALIKQCHMGTLAPKPFTGPN